MTDEIEHKSGCTWGDSDCEYKVTHHYCPHEEHKSLECICFDTKSNASGEERAAPNNH